MHPPAVPSRKSLTRFRVIPRQLAKCVNRRKYTNRRIRKVEKFRLWRNSFLQSQSKWLVESSIKPNPIKPKFLYSRRFREILSVNTSQQTVRLQKAYGACAKGNVQLKHCKCHYGKRAINLIVMDPNPNQLIYKTPINLIFIWRVFIRLKTINKIWAQLFTWQLKFNFQII